MKLFQQRKIWSCVWGLVALIASVSSLLAQPDVLNVPQVDEERQYTHRTLHVSPDGRFAAQLSRHSWSDGKAVQYAPKGTQVKLWEIATGHLKWEKWSPANIASTGSFSPDSKRFLCYGTSGRPQGDTVVEESSQFVIWDVESGQSQEKIELTPGQWLFQLVFMPDSKSLIGTVALLPELTMKVQVWDATSGAVVRTVDDFPVPQDVIFPTTKGKYLVTTTLATAQREEEDKFIRVLSLPDLQLLHSLNIGKEQLVWAALSLDGSKLAYWASIPAADDTLDSQIYLWDLKTNAVTPVAAPVIRFFTLNAIEFSPDGQTLIGSGGTNDPMKIQDGEVWLWNSQTGNLEKSLNEHKKWRAGDWYSFQIRLLPDGKSFIATDGEGKVLLRSLEDGALIRTFE